MEENVLVNEEVTVILPFDKQGEYYIEDLGEVKSKPFYAFVKRTMDIVCSLVALLVFMLPMIVIAILIKLDSEGDALYFQERLGFNGKKFNIIKFRTMCSNAEEAGIQWSSGEDDTRITALGKMLRKTRLDELPQLWCILKGDMSLVGPRPEREVYYIEFEKYIHGFSERLKVKPGLTGHAQINGGYDLKPEEKIIYDVEYIKERSLWFDLKIIFGTVKVVFTHKGAK